MALNLNNTTPAATAGYANVLWQADVNNNASAELPNIGGVSTQTGAYTILATDGGTLIQLNAATAQTITLPAAAPFNKWQVNLKNIGTGVWTVARNGLLIEGQTINLSLSQGDSVNVYTDGTNYFTSAPRPSDVSFFTTALGLNNQVVSRYALTRTTIFPASAPNAVGSASATATGSTTYTFKKNGVSFAIANFGAGQSIAIFTQASTTTFNPGDILELDGPATADATLAKVGFSLQGYRF